MAAINAITLRNRRDVHFAEQYEVPLFRTRGPKQRQPCWTIEKDMAMLDTVLRGFHCGPLYILQDVENTIDDVFDGAHRCEAVFNFIDNKYPVTKGKKDTIQWETSPLRDHVGKYFRELPIAMQKQIKEYCFYINIIDSETAGDADALSMLWERLSWAGMKLNTFEAKIQTHYTFQKEVLEPCAADWLKTLFFPAEKSLRGQAELKLQKLLALSEYEVLPAFGSMEDLVKMWGADVLGKSTESIEASTQAKKEGFLGRLRYMRNLFKELQDRNIFHVDGEPILDKSKDVPLLIIMGRLACSFTAMSSFRRVADEVCPTVHDILKMNPNDLCKHLKVNSRNASFQKKLIEYVDSKFKPLSDKAKERRCFTPAEKTKKLKEQGGLCAECQNPIHGYQRNAGDHIVEYCKGGETAYENLQILHKICHEEKNMIRG